MPYRHLALPLWPQPQRTPFFFPSRTQAVTNMPPSIFRQPRASSACTYRSRAWPACSCFPPWTPKWSRSSPWSVSSCQVSPSPLSSRAHPLTLSSSPYISWGSLQVCWPGRFFWRPEGLWIICHLLILFSKWIHRMSVFLNADVCHESAAWYCQLYFFVSGWRSSRSPAS